MQHVIKTYYTENGSWKIEECDYRQVGTHGVDENDPRAISLGFGSPDLWVCISITNPKGDADSLPYTTKTVRALNKDTGLFEDYEQPDQPILGPNYYNSNHWNPGAVPARPGVVIKTEAEYEAHVEAQQS